MTDAVFYEIRDGVGIATLNRPEKFNCISSELLRGLSAALAAFEDDTSVRVMLIQANGKQFCTGADLLEITEARKARRTVAQYVNGDQHAQFGLIPGGGGSQRLPRIVGLRRALELMYSARWLDAAEAQNWGLVNRVVPAATLREASYDFCVELTTRNPQGLSAMKQLARKGLAMSPADGLRFEEDTVVGELLTDNVSEGLAAFQQRRTPAFK